MTRVREKIGEFAVTHSQELSLNQFHQVFGEEDGIDLFYFGVYTTDIKGLAPWQEEKKKELIDKSNDTDDNDKNQFDVDPTYGSLIEHEKRKREKEEQEKLEKEKTEQRFWLFIISFIVALCVSIFFCKR